MIEWIVWLLKVPAFVSPASLLPPIAVLCVIFGPYFLSSQRTWHCPFFLHSKGMTPRYISLAHRCLLRLPSGFLLDFLFVAISLMNVCSYSRFPIASLSHSLLFSPPPSKMASHDVAQTGLNFATCCLRLPSTDIRGAFRLASQLSRFLSVLSSHRHYLLHMLWVLVSSLSSHSSMLAPHTSADPPSSGHVLKWFESLSWTLEN